MSDSYIDFFGMPEVSAFTDEEKHEAKELAVAINASLRGIQAADQAAAQSYVRLGSAVYRVQEKMYWMLWGFESFGKYVDSIKDKLSKGRTQIYNAVGVVKQLGPYVEESKLETMGISKANLLAAYTRRTGLKPAQKLIDTAVDERTTLQKLKSDIFAAENRKDCELSTRYVDFGGAYLSDEERKEINRAFEVAARVDPALPVELSESARRREVMLRLAREFLSTYEASVERGEA